MPVSGVRPRSANASYLSRNSTPLWASVLAPMKPATSASGADASVVPVSAFVTAPDDQLQSARPRHRLLLSPWRSRRLASARRDARGSSVATARDPVTETPALSGREHSRVDQDGAAYRDHLALVEHATVSSGPG